MEKAAGACPPPSSTRTGLPPHPTLSPAGAREKRNPLPRGGEGKVRGRHRPGAQSARWDACPFFVSQTASGKEHRHESGTVGRKTGGLTIASTEREKAGEERWGVGEGTAIPLSSSDCRRGKVPSDRRTATTRGTLGSLGAVADRGQLWRRAHSEK